MYIKLYTYDETQKEKRLKDRIKTLREQIEIIKTDIGLSTNYPLEILDTPHLYLTLIPHKFIKNLINYIQDKIKYKKEYAKYLKSFNYKKSLWAENIKEGDRYLKIDDKFKRIYYISEIPSQVLPGIFFGILNSSIPLVLSLHVSPIQPRSIIKAVKNTKSSLYAFSENRQRKGRMPKKEIELQIEQAEEFEESLLRGEQKAFLVSIYLSIEADSQEQLYQRHKFIKTISDESQISLSTYSYEQKKAFESVLPVSKDTIKKTHVMQSDLCSYILPFVSKNIYDPKGIFIGESYTSSELLFLDLFKARNANINIFGTSGSGKSVTAKLLALRSWMRNCEVIIIDPEGEYTNLSKNLGGEIIRFDKEYGINPFYIKDTKYIDDHIQNLKIFFRFFISEASYDSAYLDEVLVKLYKNFKKPCFENFLSLIDRPNISSDLKILNTGSLKGIFNTKNNLNYNSELSVIDISRLETDEKKKPAMFLLASIIFREIKNSDKKRLLFIDEAHLLLRDKLTAEFYLTLVKTARKYNAGIISITQNIEDYFNDIYNVGQGIISNAETSILLKQSFSSIDLLKRTYPLNDNEFNMLPLLDIGEALLFREKEHIRIRIIPLDFECSLIC